MKTDWDQIDWAALQRLRTAFLEGSAGREDYWQSESDLASYDQTFAQRIGWKWDYVLGELDKRHWQPPPGTVLDWGCGTGIAHRAFLDFYDSAMVSQLHLWDRSPRATAFAARRAEAKYPDLSVKSSAPDAEHWDLLLLSHVLTELSAAQTQELMHIVQRSTAVLWVEPGTCEVSHRLIQIREDLRGSFNLVAPCTHNERCGMLAPENSAHWCHQFAPPPPGLFQDSNWARFATSAGIDLRSLPLSFLVLDKRPVAGLPDGAVRIIGRPRVYKSHALLLGSERSGVHERRLSKRLFPERFRLVKKGLLPSLQVWTCADQEIVGLIDAKPSTTPNSGSHPVVRNDGAE